MLPSPRMSERTQFLERVWWRRQQPRVPLSQLAPRTCAHLLFERGAVLGICPSCRPFYILGIHPNSSRRPGQRSVGLRRWSAADLDPESTHSRSQPQTRRNVWRRRPRPRCVFFPPPALLHFLPLLLLGSPLRVLGLLGRLWGFVSLSSPLPARLGGSFLRGEVDGGHAWLTLAARAVANLARAPLSYERGAACGAHAPLVTPSVHSIACDRVGIHPWTTTSPGFFCLPTRS